MRPLTHFFKTFKPELKQFLQQSWTPCLCLFGSPSEANREKNTFSVVEISLPPLVAFMNTKMRREEETKGIRSTTKQDFSGEGLSRQNIKAWLASLSCDLSRVPTGYHICIQCINCQSNAMTQWATGPYICRTQLLNKQPAGHYLLARFQYFKLCFQSF